MKKWTRPEVHSTNIKDTEWGAYPAKKTELGLYVNNVEALNQQIKLRSLSDDSTLIEDLFSGQ